MTVGMPTGYWNGSVNVARSATVAGSKITRSAASPSLISPRSRDVQLRRREAAHLVDRLLERDDVLLADVLAEHARERAEVARVRHAGAQRPADVASADPSDPTDTHGCCIASLRSLSSMMNQTQLTLPPLRDQDLEDEVVRVLARLLRGIVDPHALVALVARVHARARRQRRELDVVPRAGRDQPVLPRRVRVVHLLADALRASPDPSAARPASRCRLRAPTAESSAISPVLLATYGY